MLWLLNASPLADHSVGFTTYVAEFSHNIIFLPKVYMAGSCVLDGVKATSKLFFLFLKLHLLEDQREFLT